MSASFNRELNVPPGVQDALYSGVQDLFGVTQRQLEGDSRTRAITQARWAVILALRAWDPSITYEQLARAVYRTDHTTAMNAIRQGSQLVQTDATFRQRVQALADRVGTRAAPDFLATDDVAYWVQQAHIWRNRFVALQSSLAAIQDHMSLVTVQVAPMLPEAQQLGGQPTLEDEGGVA
jgi:hypothetical protein